MFARDPLHRHLLCLRLFRRVCSITPRARSPESNSIYAPPLWLIALGAALVGLAAAGVLYAWPPSRERRRIVVGAAAAVAAFLVWRGALIFADGANFDIDYPLLLGLSFEDIGSGVMAFLFAGPAFGLGTDRARPAQLVVTCAALVGGAAMLVDRFV